MTTAAIQRDDSGSVTSTRLLAGLFDAQNDAAWLEFHAGYAPIILGVARRCGLNEADAADVVQDTLTCFLRDYQAGKYSRERGRLRSWLVGIVRRRIADLRRWRIGRRELRGESAIIEAPDTGEVEALWEQERRRALLDRAMRELRESTRFGKNTIAAFEAVVLRGEAVAAVASGLGMTVSDVYAAKCRATERLRGIIERLEAQQAGGL